MNENIKNIRFSNIVRLFDANLDLFLAKKNNINPKLLQSIKYVALAKGKRIRPILTYLCAELFEIPKKQVDPIAIAIELMHCYSLVHDDLPAMDDDDLRRGKSTCHIVFGEALAILTGDALQTMAFESISTARHLKPEQKIIAINELVKAAGVNGMVCGQADDIANIKPLSLSQLELIYYKKTTKLLKCAFLLPALLAKATPKQTLCLTSFIDKIGLAYQIQDDILDAIGDPNITGKKTKNDEKNNKLTYLKATSIASAKKKVTELTKLSLQETIIFKEKKGLLEEVALFILKRKH